VESDVRLISRATQSRGAPEGAPGQALSRKMGRNVGRYLPVKSDVRLILVTTFA